MAAEYYDALETRDPEQRERELMAALPSALAHAKRHAPALAGQLADIDPAEISSRDALARLPVVRKSELLQRQQAARPFGGFSAVGWRGAQASGGQAAKVFASPGPLYEPESRRPDYWRMARGLFAAGFRTGDLVHNCFAYHLTPAGSMMEGAALALGCTVFPGGTGNTEQQVQAMLDLQPDGYVGTPSFLKIILDRAEELGTPVTSLRHAVVSGEAFLPAVQAYLAARGIDAYQSYATADIGLIAYQTPARDGLVINEQLIVEIVVPGTGEPVGPGEVGEVVVTTLNPDYPLVRFGTGDLSALLPGVSPCGRTAPRLKGWLGRADQTAKVKGMFVHPSQVADVVCRYAEISRARLVVVNPDATDHMTLWCETLAPDTEALRDRIAGTLREVTKLRGDVKLVTPGTLANDGKVIEDARDYG